MRAWLLNGLLSSIAALSLSACASQAGDEAVCDVTAATDQCSEGYEVIELDPKDSCLELVADPSCGSLYEAMRRCVAADPDCMDENGSIEFGDCAAEADAWTDCFYGPDAEE